MDLASLIASFATGAGTYAVTRTARGATVRGRVAVGTASTLAIVASVTPATGADLIRLPEGRRANETRVLYTTTELLVGGQGVLTEADRVSIDGIDWEVQHVESWRDNDLGDGQLAYRCVVQAAL